MQLDPSIILSARPLKSLADLAADRDDRQMRRQELDLRQQEIENRRLAMEQARQPKPQAPPTAQEQLAAINLNLKRAEIATNAIEKARPETWAMTRSQLAALLGPEATSDLPMEFPGSEWVTQHVEAGRAAQGQIAKQAEQFTLTPGAKRFDASGKVIAEVPAAERATTESGFTLAPGARRYDASGNLIATAPERPQAAPSSGGGGRDSLVEAVMANPSVYDTLTPTAKTQIAPELAKRGFDFAARTKSAAPTGAQGKSLSFFNRAKQASEDLDSVEAEIAKMGTARQAWESAVPAFMQSETGQLYTQAQRAFTEARLRKESGAAIAQDEYDKDRKTYFVQPGDSPATIEQKRRARANLLASMAFEAGPAFEQYYGDDAKSIVDSYRSTAKSPASAKASKKMKVGRFEIEVED